MSEDLFYWVLNLIILFYLFFKKGNAVTGGSSVGKHGNLEGKRSRVALPVKRAEFCRLR